ncbi:group-specific protein [Gorillibacterium timonense]|uniref:group-specific protein n=1 Tax=Gorillibacterium timonense TaxID=1689269 RepID=UPI00071E4ED4|nr:group-specific protein [Gorillibacterium timonense]
MIEIHIDQHQVNEFVKEKISDILKQLDSDYVFWDSKQLSKLTCMSWGTIQSTFFFHPDFQKHKIGGKWYFPAREAREFLERWLKEH